MKSEVSGNSEVVFDWSVGFIEDTRGVDVVVCILICVVVCCWISVDLVK